VYGTDKSRAFNIIDRLNRARSDGLIITADVYPYMASYTGIGIVFPDWAKTKRTFDLAKIHRKEELEAFLYQKIMSRNGPEATLFATRPFIGKTLAEASQETGKSFVDILMALGPEGASGAYFVMNENIQEAFICNPDIAIGSDGGPNLRHPRSYGTFAKMIRKYVMEETKLTLEQAVHKMTGLPASIINLPNRGLIKEGYYADILVFDPHRVEDKATFSNPYEPSSGFDWVFINGKIVLHKTEVFCPDCGKVLRCNSEGP
jgi:N-acyl-D-aspartate/D-glutamate deacylase